MARSAAAEVLARIDAVAPILERTAAESERLRTLCPEAVAALHRAGLFGMWVPREAGGFDVDLVTQVDALTALARADMSACWTLMIGNTVTASMAALLPDDGFREVFAGDRMPVAAGSLKSSGRAEPVADGYRVSGRWGFGSGIRHADWIVANCQIEEDGTGRALSLAIPIDQVQVEDDWHVAGLCGTGSCSYAACDVLVPPRRALGDARRGTYFHGKAGLRIPIEHAAVSLGGARRALDEAASRSAEKRRLFDADTVASKQSFLVELGRLEAEWASLLDGVRAAARELDQAAQGARGIRPAAIKLRAVSALAVETSLAIGGRALRSAGAAAIRRGGVIERVHRDLVASAQHVMVSDAAYEAYAEALLGAAARPE